MIEHGADHHAAGSTPISLLMPSGGEALGTSAGCSGMDDLES